MPLIDTQFLNLLGTVIGLVALVFVALTIRTIRVTDTAVFTSRMYLTSGRTVRDIVSMLVLISAAAVLLTAVHATALFTAEPFVESLLTTVATTCIAFTVITLYRLTRHLATTATPGT